MEACAEFYILCNIFTMKSPSEWFHWIPRGPRWKGCHWKRIKSGAIEQVSLNFPIYFSRILRKLSDIANAINLKQNPFCNSEHQLLCYSLLVRFPDATCKNRKKNLNNYYRKPMSSAQKRPLCSTNLLATSTCLQFHMQHTHDSEMCALTLYFDQFLCQLSDLCKHTYWTAVEHATHPEYFPTCANEVGRWNRMCGGAGGEYVAAKSQQKTV